MTTPPQPAPPEVPAWAVKAAEAIVPSQSVFDVEYRAHVVERVSATIARHAPTPAPATDYAELLEMDDDVEILLSVRSGWTRKDKERALNRLLCRQACPPPVTPCPTEQGESLSQDELDVDAFNKWNRDIDYYTPTLWDAFVYGCAHARSALQTPQPAAPIGHRELCEELKQVHDTLRINSFGREALVITNAIAALQRLAGENRRLKEAK